MSMFKQGLLLSWGAMLLILLVACSPKTQTLTLQKFDSRGLDSRVTLYYQGDRLVKLSMTSIMFYKYLEMANAQEAKRFFGPFTKAYETLDGHDISHDFKEEHCIEFLEIDCEKAVLDDNDSLLYLMLSQDGQSVSFKKAKEHYLSLQFKIVQDHQFQELPK